MEYLFPPNRPYRVVPKKPPVDVQLERIWNYLSETQQKINRNLERCTPYSQSAQILKLIENADNFNSHSTKVSYDRRVYAALKANIMKTADIVVRDSQTFSKTLAGTEAFVSEFGRLFSSATLKIEGTPVGIRQLYTWHEKLNGEFGNYVTNSQQYIKDGLLGFDGVSPIYGIEVGLINEIIETVDADGNKITVSVADPIKTRITPSEWSLWRNDQKLCYTNENNIYFPSAHITGGSIKIGSNFTVDNAGNMTAKSGMIAGWNIGPNTSGYNSGIHRDVTIDSIKHRIGLKADTGGTSYAFYVRKFASGSTSSTPDGDIVFAVRNNGSMFATAGTIGGWTLTTQKLYGGTESAGTCVVMQIPSSSTSTAFAAGGNDHSDYSGAPFRVRADGYMKATKGKIGGWTINEKFLESTIGNAAFRITGTTDSDYTTWIYAKDTDGTTVFKVQKDGKLVATNAEIKGTIKAGTVIQTSTSSALTKIGNLTVWPYDDDSTMFRSGENATKPYSRLILSETYAYFDCYGTSNSAGIILNATNGTGKLRGTWSYSSGSGDLSDQTKKKDISDLSEQYSVLFDALKPRTYKYIDGTSNRTHIGFIAQEVSAAIESAGLTSQDAALVMEIQDYDDYGKPTETSTLFLRYGEIIALLVKEVQDMKKQLTEIQQAV